MIGTLFLILSVGFVFGYICGAGVRVLKWAMPEPENTAVDELSVRRQQREEEIGEEDGRS